VIVDYLDPANHAITGKSNTQVIIKALVATNATPPAINFTLFLSDVRSSV
jgi:hypothetical protein